MSDPYGLPGPYSSDSVLIDTFILFYFFFWVLLKSALFFDKMIQIEKFCERNTLN